MTIRDSRLIRYGLWGLLLGTGPLVLAVAFGHLTGDDNPNPVGFGILAFFTFWPSIILIVIGFIQALVRGNTTD